jgi:chemotaxis family two-component system response regulator Rcp1
MSVRETVQKREILLAEDSPAEVRLMQEVIKECGLDCNLHVVEDGSQVMDFLMHGSGFESAPRPDIILLDLNMPKEDGYDVLTEIKSRRDLRLIPVIVLSSSNSNRDIRSAYQLNANCYINKPSSMSDFVKVIKSIGDFWFNTVKLPQV